MPPVHQCHVCGKQLTRGTMLVTHLRSHTGERPFSCPICPKAFARSWDLQQHRNTHGAARNFRCACGVSFHRRQDLLRHTKKVSNYHCDVAYTTQYPMYTGQSASINGSQASLPSIQGLLHAGIAPMMQTEETDGSVEALERELLEDNDIFFLGDEESDETSHAEVSMSLDDKLVPVLNKRSSFYRLTMALYRVARLAKAEPSIETDTDMLEIQAGAIADLKFSVRIHRSINIMDNDTILAVAIAILIEALIRDDDNLALRVHIGTLSWLRAAATRLHREESPAQVMSADTVDNFIDIVIVGARACALGWLPSSDFVIKLATTMFRAGPSINLPKLVEDSFRIRSSDSVNHEADGKQDDSSKQIFTSARLIPELFEVTSAATPVPHLPAMLSTPSKTVVDNDSVTDFSATSQQDPARSPTRITDSSLIRQSRSGAINQKAPGAFANEDIHTRSKITVASLTRSWAIEGLPGSSVASSIQSESGPARSTEGPTAQQWQDLKEEIRDLYSRKPLKDIRTILEHRYGFRATDRMFKSRLSAWGFSKNSRDREYQICARLLEMRKRQGKHESHFLIHGSRRSLKDLHKYIKGRKMSEDEFVARAERDIQIQDLSDTQHVRAYTPDLEEFQDGDFGGSSHTQDREMPTSPSAATNTA